MALNIRDLIKKNNVLIDETKAAEGKQLKAEEAWCDVRIEITKLRKKAMEAQPKPSYITINRRDDKPSPINRGGYKVTKKTAMEMDKTLKKVIGNLYEGKPFIFETVDGKRVTIDRSRIEEIHIQIGD